MRRVLLPMGAPDVTESNDYDNTDEMLKYHYGHFVISSVSTAEPAILGYLRATPEERERRAKERREQQAADQPMLDAFLADFAALRAKYPDVRILEDEYNGFVIMHGAAREWVEADG